MEPSCIPTRLPGDAEAAGLGPRSELGLLEPWLLHSSTDLSANILTLTTLYPNGPRSSPEDCHVLGVSGPRTQPRARRCPSAESGAADCVPSRHVFLVPRAPPSPSLIPITGSAAGTRRKGGGWTASRSGFVLGTFSFLVRVCAAQPLLTTSCPHPKPHALAELAEEVPGWVGLGQRGAGVSGGPKRTLGSEARQRETFFWDHPASDPVTNGMCVLLRSEQK